jgi:hypothetical protein
METNYSLRKAVMSDRLVFLPAAAALSVLLNGKQFAVVFVGCDQGAKT